MRSAGNFHPEWGYLAPAPSFMRTVRIALVATAIGATAGAVVVVSLLARPGSNDEDTSIAAHALVTSAPVVTSPAAPASPVFYAPAPIAQAPIPAKTTPVASVPTPTSAAAAGAVGAVDGPSKPNTPNTPLVTSPPTPSPAPASVAALDDTPATVDATPAAEPESAKKTVSKKHHIANYDGARRWESTDDARRRWRDNRGFGPLFRLFSFRTGSSSYSN